MSNHLLFVDDLKLLAESEGNAFLMIKETQRFFSAVGLEMNKQKSATNTLECSEYATMLDGLGGYKYLGIMQDSAGRLTKETF